MFSSPRHSQMILDATSEGRVIDWIERIAQIARRLPDFNMTRINWNQAPTHVADQVVDRAYDCAGLDKLEEAVVSYRASAQTNAAPAASEVTVKPLRVKSGTVHSVSGTLSPALRAELCNVLLKFFPNGMGLDEFVESSQIAGEPLNHFTTTPASWRTKCAELIIWCLENGKLPALINKMRKEKPGNGWIREFVQNHSEEE